jgi:hypothetical protein
VERSARTTRRQKRARIDEGGHEVIDANTKGRVEDLIEEVREALAAIPHGSAATPDVVISIASALSALTEAVEVLVTAPELPAPSDGPAEGGALPSAGKAPP